MDNRGNQVEGSGIASSTVPTKSDVHIVDKKHKIRLRLGFKRVRIDVKKILAVVVAICIPLAIFFGYNAIKDFNRPGACSEKTSSNALGSGDISIALSPQALDSLQAIAKKIESSKNYKKDTTCLYVMTIYGINTGNAKLAREYFELLSKKYKKTSDLSVQLGAGVFTIDELRNQVEFLEKQVELLDASVPSDLQKKLEKVIEDGTL